MQDSLYNLITNRENLDFNYFNEIKEYSLFQPLIEIREEESNVENGVQLHRYTREEIIQMIKYVVYCFSKESPYLKPDITLNTVKVNVCKALSIDDELQSKILEYKIPALDEVINRFIRREDDENLRELLVCKSIYEKSLDMATLIISEDPKKSSEFYKTAEQFKHKIYELKQASSKSHFVFNKMVKDFAENVQSLKVEDLIN